MRARRPASECGRYSAYQPDAFEVVDAGALTIAGKQEREAKLDEIKAATLEKVGAGVAANAHPAVAAASIVSGQESQVTWPNQPTARRAQQSGQARVDNSDRGRQVTRPA